jgi:hypothetical protein
MSLHRAKNVLMSDRRTSYRDHFRPTDRTNNPGLDLAYDL